MNLSGNKILITGATAGIGYAILKQFLACNNQIIAVGRNEEKLFELSQLDNRITPFKCDISKKEQLNELILFIEKEHPDLNILINNAGIQYNYSFLNEKHILSKIEHEINVNLTAPTKLIALLIPTLKLNTNSAIINVSSGLGLVPKMAAPVYCGTKAAIHIFSKSLRYQLDDINVFEIIPPLVDTNMTKGRGSGKITPDQLAKEFLNAFQRNVFEVNIGKVKLLKIVYRLFPRLMEKKMKGTF